MFTIPVYKRFEKSPAGNAQMRKAGPLPCVPVRALFPRALFSYSARSVHHGAQLTYEELQETAHRLLKRSDYTQQQMADRLDVSRISVARAVTEPGPKFQRLQMRIVEALSAFTVERRERVEFRTWSTNPSGSSGTEEVDSNAE